MHPSKSRKILDSPNIWRNEKPSIDYFAFLRKIVWPVIPEEQEKIPPPKHRCPIGLLFKHVGLEYPAEINELVSNQPTIEVGKHFDVLSLLSCNYETNHLIRKNGDRVELKKDTFKDKNVMICCLNVPVFRHDCRSSLVQSLATLCSDLYALKPDNFEMVVVAKMHSLANYKEIFDHFLSGFPSSCLAVPFSYSMCRDYICKYLDLGPVFAKCLLVDGHSDVLFFDIPNFLPNHGAEAFPFTPKLLQDLAAEDFPLWKCGGKSTLEGLLQCRSSDLLFNSNPADDQGVSISKLKEKVVGLYLFVGGDSVLAINDIYEQCRADRQFEIVLVGLSSAHNLDPEVHEAKIDRLLQKHNISWWRVPFNNSLSCRLWRLLGSPLWDRLVILGPHDGYVDPYGREVMMEYGKIGFPFTRENLVNREYTKLKELTLESLLVYGSRNYVFKHNKMVTVEELKQRNILLYFGCLENLDLYYNLQGWYHKILEQDSSNEVVHVRRAVDYYPENTAEDDEVSRSVMPWLVCPFNADHSRYVQEKLFMDFRRSCPEDILVQFGKDGRICTIKAYDLLRDKGTDAFPFEDNLHQDVISRLKAIHEFMDYY
ncbi:putative nucleoredoxin 1-1 [Bienertia sinuspersici]